MRAHPILLTLSLASAPVWAADAGGASSSGSLLQVLLVLIVVLGFMLGAAWLLKRFNVAGKMSGDAVKIVGGIAVGSRERIVVIEVADQWIVVGITASNINALSTMPKQDVVAPTTESPLSGNFSDRLKQFIERRNGK